MIIRIQLGPGLPEQLEPTRWYAIDCLYAIHDELVDAGYTIGNRVGSALRYIDVHGVKDSDLSMFMLKYPGFSIDYLSEDAHDDYTIKSL